MLPLLEISKRIKEGKGNNGRAIIFNLKKYFEEKYPQDYIVKMLKEQYEINISVSHLKVLKNRYYKELYEIEPIKNKIAQNQENKITPLQEINKNDLRTDYEKLVDSIEMIDYNSPVQILAKEKEKSEKLINLFNLKKE